MLLAAPARIFSLDLWLSSMDTEWLEKEIKDLFGRNRVVLRRDGKQVCYHAPYLKSEIEFLRGYLAPSAGYGDRGGKSSGR